MLWAREGGHCPLESRQHDEYGRGRKSDLYEPALSPFLIDGNPETKKVRSRFFHPDWQMPIAHLSVPYGFETGFTWILSLGTVESFATAQNAKGLLQAATGVCERIRSRRVELKHLEMAGNHQPCAHVVRQLCGFRPRQIARNAPFWSTAVDG